jgi:hypothetical protein
MAIGAAKTFVAGEILTASDLNNEFLHVYQGGENLGWPATKAKDFAGQVLTLDAAGNVTLDAATVNLLVLKLAGVALFRWDGTATTPINGIDFVATETEVMPSLTVTSVSDTNVDLNVIPMGTGNLTQSGTRVLLLGDEQTELSILASQVFG